MIRAGCARSNERQRASLHRTALIGISWVISGQVSGFLMSAMCQELTKPVRSSSVVRVIPPYPNAGSLKGSALRRVAIVNQGSSLIISARATSAGSRWFSMICPAARKRSRPGFIWRALCTSSRRSVDGPVISPASPPCATPGIGGQSPLGPGTRTSRASRNPNP